MKNPLPSLKTIILVSLAVLSSVLFPAILSAKNIPEIQAPYTWIPVNIDGDLENEVWKDIASSVDDFSVFTDGKPASKKTQALLAYDKQYLYVAFVCHEPKLAELKSDPGIFKGDDVEVFIDPGQSYEYTHVAVNPDGKLYLAWQQGDRKNSAKVAAKKFSDRWQVEMAIPFMNIKMPNPAGMKPLWGINFCRAFPRQSESVTWSPTLSSFHNPARFGVLKGIRELDLQKIYQTQMNAPKEMLTDIQLRADRTFYDAQKQVKAGIRVKETVTLSGKSLRLTLSDRDGKVQVRKECPQILLTNEETLDIGKLPAGDYTLNAEIIEKGKVVSKASKYLAKIDPLEKPENLVRIENGIMHLNGKPHLPMIVWFCAQWDKCKYLSVKDVEDIADKGFTGIMPHWAFFKSELEEFEPAWGKNASDVKSRLRICKETPIDIQNVLDASLKNNLYVAMNIPWIWRAEKLDDDQIRAGGKCILKYRRHPAVMCWLSNDETDGWTDLNRETYRMHKELDPYRPVYLNLIQAVPSNRDAADILSTDPYPIGKTTITKVSHHVDVLRKTIGNNPKQTYWVVLQMFGSPHEKWPRCPNPVEERCMIFLSLNHGAKGFNYFVYHPEITRKETGDKYLSEDLWQSMKELNRQTREMSLPYLVGKDIPNISCRQESIDLAAKEHHGECYIIACNTSEKEVKAEICSPSSPLPQKLSVIYENRDIAPDKGILKDTFSGYAVHIYKFPKGGK
ncbi:MAG: sugar-binding protein [Verrucomicrobiae bacterium]|nr:sugar-binding protein [Verrucomicrobiae bacterium]